MKTFPRVSCIIWERNPLDLFADDALISYPPTLQHHFLQNLGPLNNLCSLRVSFEDGVGFFSRCSSYLSHWSTTLQDIYFSGRVVNVIQFLRALPPASRLQSLSIGAHGSWSPFDLLSVLMSLPAGSQEPMFDCLELCEEESPPVESDMEDINMFRGCFSIAYPGLHHAIGPHLRFITLDLNLDLAFPSNFLDVFAGAPRIKHLLIGLSVAEVSFPTTDICFEDIVDFAKMAKELAVLHVPWAWGSKDLTDTGDLEDVNKNLMILGIACFAMSIEDEDIIPPTIRRCFPYLTRVEPLTCFSDDWEGIWMS